MNYDIRDIELAPSGKRKIEWVKEQYASAFLHRRRFQT